jgi:hypothetical protein
MTDDSSLQYDADDAFVFLDFAMIARSAVPGSLPNTWNIADGGIRELPVPLSATDGPAVLPLAIVGRLLWEPEMFGTVAWISVTLRADDPRISLGTDAMTNESMARVVVPMASAVDVDVAPTDWAITLLPAFRVEGTYIVDISFNLDGNQLVGADLGRVEFEVVDRQSPWGTALSLGAGR